MEVGKIERRDGPVVIALLHHRRRRIESRVGVAHLDDVERLDRLRVGRRGREHDGDERRRNTDSEEKRFQHRIPPLRDDRRSSREARITRGEGRRTEYTGGSPGGAEHLQTLRDVGHDRSGTGHAV
jgi:hypothetical protein